MTRALKDGERCKMGEAKGSEEKRKGVMESSRFLPGGFLDLMSIICFKKRYTKTAAKTHPSFLLF